MTGSVGSNPTPSSKLQGEESEYYIKFKNVKTRRVNCADKRADNKWTESRELWLRSVEVKAIRITDECTCSNFENPLRVISVG